MSNIKSINFYDDRGNMNSDGNYVCVELHTPNQPTIEEENIIFDKLLTKMTKNYYIYFYIEYYAEDFEYDDSSIEMARRLGRTQEIKELVSLWLDC